MEEDEKKTEHFLVRVEKDVREFYVNEAKRRRVKVAQVIRELLYKHMEEQKKGSTNG